MTLRKGIKFLTLFLFIFFLWNYGPFYFTKQEREWRKERQEEKSAIAEYRNYVAEIRYAFGKKMLEDFQLVPTGQSGMMHRKIEMLGMEFTAYRRATIQEARALQLLVMDRFVKIIKAHEKIQPFLEEKPFSSNSIEISISIEGPNGRYCDESVERVVNLYTLTEAMVKRNILFYYSLDSYENMTFELFKEYYEDALKIVNSSTNLNPYAHKTTPMEEALDEMYATFISDMEEAYHLECDSIGGKMPNLVEEIGAKFDLVKHTSQEEARELLVAVTRRLIDTLNQSQKLRPYLAEHPFPTKRLKLRINFTQSNHFSYSDGSMVSITLDKDKITYFKISPDDKQVRSNPFDEESYQEAERTLVGNTYSLKKS